VGASVQEIFASWNGQFGWRWMFAVTAIPSLLFLIATFFVPESPRWLAAKSRDRQAHEILVRLGGAAFAEQVLQDLKSATNTEPCRPLLRELAYPGLAKALLLGTALAILQQWCGINVIFNYAQEIFAAAGYQISGILFNIVITGTVNLVFTVIALATIDRYGRRPLLLAGTLGLALIYTVLGGCYRMHVQGVFMLLLVLAAIACYAVSLAPVTWVVIAEIFPNRVRGSAMSVAVTALWLACFVLTYTFPLLNASVGPAGIFWIFAAICLAGLAFVARSLPETRGRTLEEIESSLHSG
jgi:sugar porter (SP) family MFS transporter